MTVFTRTWRAAALAVLTLLSLGDSRFARLDAQQPVIDQTLLNAYKWRSIGPDRGGRSIAATGVKGRPREAYFGAVGGGLWKTTDGGLTWRSVTDGQIHSSSVGAVAVSASNPDVVYIGMGGPASAATSRATASPSPPTQEWANVGFKNVDDPRSASTTNGHCPCRGARPVQPERKRGSLQDDRRRQDPEAHALQGRTGAVDIASTGRIRTPLRGDGGVRSNQTSSGGAAVSQASTDGRPDEIYRETGMPSGMVWPSASPLRADSARLLVENAETGPVRSGRCGVVVEVD
jgi:hypothetical protein